MTELLLNVVQVDPVSFYLPNIDFVHFTSICKYTHHGHEKEIEVRRKRQQYMVQLLNRGIKGYMYRGIRLPRDESDKEFDRFDYDSTNDNRCIRNRLILEPFRDGSGYVSEYTTGRELDNAAINMVSWMRRVAARADEVDEKDHQDFEDKSKITFKGKSAITVCPQSLYEPLRIIKRKYLDGKLVEIKASSKYGNDIQYCVSRTKRDNTVCRE